MTLFGSRVCSGHELRSSRRTVGANPTGDRRPCERGNVNTDTHAGRMSCVAQSEAATSRGLTRRWEAGTGAEPPLQSSEGVQPCPARIPGFLPPELRERENKCLLLKPLSLQDFVMAARRNSRVHHYVLGTSVPNLQERMGTSLSFPRGIAVKPVRIHLQTLRPNS